MDPIIAAPFMPADAKLALFNGVYTLVLAVATKPDFAVVIHGTEAILRRQG